MFKGLSYPCAGGASAAGEADIELAVREDGRRQGDAHSLQRLRLGLVDGHGEAELNRELSPLQTVSCVHLMRYRSCGIVRLTRKSNGSSDSSAHVRTMRGMNARPPA